MLPHHLGGHKNRTHLDEGSIKYVKKILNVKSMLDIGCGPGGMVKLARDLEIEAYGIDGDYEVKRPNVDNRWITIHDYESGPSNFTKQVDLIWSCEFVEHVHEKFIPNYMADFQNGNFVIMTYAPPESKGHHHVNCNTEQYWKDIFKKYGFQFDANMTRQIREVSTMNVGIGKKEIIKAFVKYYGLCFVRI